MDRRSARVRPLLVALLGVAVAVTAACSTRAAGIPTLGSTVPSESSTIAPPLTSANDVVPTTEADEPTDVSSPSTPAAASSTLSSPSTIPTTPTTATEQAEPTTATSTSTTTETTTGPAVDLPGVGLAGVNVASCRSAEPPVLLLHGSFSTAAGNFGTIAPALQVAGRCVYAIDYGSEGTAAIKDSAAEVAVFVQHVLADTGASKLDVVGYSQGGLVLRTALRLDGIADEVRVAVLLAPSFHGTTSPLARAIPAAVCPACADQVAGSDLLRQLDAGGDLDGTVHYAVLSTRYDAVVTPVSSQVPNGPSDRVQSQIVQQQCPTALTDHLGLPTSAGVPSWVLDALVTDGRPAASALTCG